MFGVARIDQLDPYARIEKGELAIAMFQLFEIELGDILEGIGRCHEGDAGALLARRRRPVDLERRNRIAMLEAHPMLFAIAPDRQFEPFAERVDDRYADAVQTARHLIGIVVARVLELPARVKLGHDDLGRRNAFLGMDAGRDAAPIVLDADRSVAVERDEYQIAMTGKCLVDRIVADFEHHMMQTRPVVGVANIHARPLAHGVEAFQHLDRIGAVAVLIGLFGGAFARAAHGGVCHADYIGSAAAKPKQKCAARRAADGRCARRRRR